MAVPTYKVEIANANGTIWKTVTASVKSINVSRGRNRELDKFEAGTFSITFNNHDRSFDPLYTSSPWYGYIVPNRKVLIYSSDAVSQYVVFAGFISDWNFSYDISGDSLAVASGTDAFGFLSQQTLNAVTRSAELSGVRAEAIFNNSGISYPVGTSYNVSANTKRTVQASTITAGSTNALDYLQTLEQTEQGFFFVDKIGQLSFLGVVDSNNKGYNFTDSGVVAADNIPYQGIDIQYGTEDLYNSISLTNVGGSSATYDNTSSQSTYGRLVYSATGLLYDSVSDTDSAARVLAIKYGDPEYRIDSVTVNINTLSSNKQGKVVPLELTDVVQVTFTPNGIGSAVNQYVRIIGIDHQMDIDQHIMTLHFQSLSNEQLLLDDSVFGLLDYNVLGF
jgi:hypothetical protein